MYREADYFCFSEIKVKCSVTWWYHFNMKFISLKFDGNCYICESIHTLSGDPVVKLFLFSFSWIWETITFSLTKVWNGWLFISCGFWDIFVVSTVSNSVSSEYISGCSIFLGKLLRYLLSLLLLDPRAFRAALPEELQSNCSKMVIRDLL